MNLYQCLLAHLPDDDLKLEIHRATRQSILGRDKEKRAHRKSEVTKLLEALRLEELRRYNARRVSRHGQAEFKRMHWVDGGLVVSKTPHSHGKALWRIEPDMSATGVARNGQTASTDDYRPKSKFWYQEGQYA